MVSTLEKNLCHFRRGKGSVGGNGRRHRLCSHQKGDYIWTPFYINCWDRAHCRAGNCHYMGMGAGYVMDFIGSVIMGAVHDFGSLIISMRNQGKSIAEYTSKYINNRTKSFFLIVFLSYG